MMGDGSVGHVDASYLAGMEAEMDRWDEEVGDEEVGDEEVEDEEADAE